MKNLKIIRTKLNLHSNCDEHILIRLCIPITLPSINSVQKQDIQKMRLDQRSLAVTGFAAKSTLKHQMEEFLLM